MQNDCIHKESNHPFYVTCWIDCTPLCNGNILLTLESIRQLHTILKHSTKCLHVRYWWTTSLTWEERKNTNQTFAAELGHETRWGGVASQTAEVRRNESTDWPSEMWDLHSANNSDCGLLGCDTVQSSRFWRWSHHVPRNVGNHLQKQHFATTHKTTIWLRVWWSWWKASLQIIVCQNIRLLALLPWRWIVVCSSEMWVPTYKYT
jgi:hypothetical protein